MPRRFLVKLLMVAALLICGWEMMQTTGAARDDAPAESAAARRVEDIYRKLRAQREAEPTNVVVAWKFAAACFDRCEFTHTDADRAQYANEGISACQWALSVAPKSAPVHYYLGMDLAQLARTKLLGALKLLDQVETEWTTTIALDENFDYAGGDRNIGLLYLDAPGWPVSLGSRAKARQHLLRAVTLHPEYPENHLNLIEAHLKWHESKLAAEAAAVYVKKIDAARKQFSGPEWESAWDDWNKRWVQLQTEMNTPGSGVSHRK